LIFSDELLINKILADDKQKNLQGFKNLEGFAQLENYDLNLFNT
jgi:hypothetical protein